MDFLVKYRVRTLIRMRVHMFMLKDVIIHFQCLHRVDMRHDNGITIFLHELNRFMANRRANLCLIATRHRNGTAEIMMTIHRLILSSHHPVVLTLIRYEGHVCFAPRHSPIFLFALAFEGIYVQGVRFVFEVLLPSRRLFEFDFSQQYPALPVHD